MLCVLTSINHDILIDRDATVFENSEAKPYNLFIKHSHIKRLALFIYSAKQNELPGFT